MHDHEIAGHGDACNNEAFRHLHARAMINLRKENFSSPVLPAWHAQKVMENTFVAGAGVCMDEKERYHHFVSGIPGINPRHRTDSVQNKLMRHGFCT